MSDLKSKKTQDKTPFEKQLEHVRRTYNLSAEDTFAFLIAVLQCYKFNVVEAGRSREWGEEGSEYRRCNGPYVWIQAAEAPAIIARFKESLGHAAKNYLRHQLWFANLRAQERLVGLLDKFYEGKKLKTSGRLIVESFADGSSLVRGQADYIMSLPENWDIAEDWEWRMRDEMSDFHLFLLANLD